MLDLKRRQTLKILSALPLVSMPFVGVANAIGLTESLAPTLPEATRRTSMQLEIQIIDSNAVPDNTVVFRNSDDEELIITKFMPGHIVFGDNVIDLNATVGGQNLILQPGQSKSFDFKVESTVNAAPIEYVWADHAVNKLSDETSVITLGAFMADTNAVVYANTRQYVLS